VNIFWQCQSALCIITTSQLYVLFGEWKNDPKSFELDNLIAEWKNQTWISEKSTDYKQFRKTEENAK